MPTCKTHPPRVSNTSQGTEPRARSEINAEQLFAGEKEVIIHHRKGHEQSADSSGRAGLP